MNNELQVLKYVGLKSPKEGEGERAEKIFQGTIAKKISKLVENYKPTRSPMNLKHKKHEENYIKVHHNQFA